MPDVRIFRLVDVHDYGLSGLAIKFAIQSTGAAHNLSHNFRRKLKGMQINDILKTFTFKKVGGLISLIMLGTDRNRFGAEKKYLNFRNRCLK